MSDNATVEIIDVVANAVKIPVTDLRATDKVFDTHGGVHNLRWVRHHKKVVTFVRGDAPSGNGWVESIGYWRETMTVIRGEA